MVEDETDEVRQTFGRFVLEQIAEHATAGVVAVGA